MPAACLDIIDTSYQCKTGTGKTAEFLVGLVASEIEDLDPDGIIIDVVMFDGAANVQLCGDILAEKFPMITSLHGVEHVLALFFSDVCKIHAVLILIRMYRIIFRVFGLGSMHAPYAMFQDECSKANSGRKVSGCLFVCLLALWFPTNSTL